MKNRLSRRKFIKGTVSAGAVIAASGFMLPDSGPDPVAEKKTRYDAKGLPVTKLGSTGVTIPRMAVGLGSRFLTIATTEEALDMCSFALDNGLYYWDTAHTYVNNATGAVSEERLGHIVKDRRKEIFLSTKLASREPDKIKAELELSLKRLQTDHLDMLKLHSVTTPEEAALISRKGGVLDVISEFREQKITRFIGFSGHANAEALKYLAETGRFDSMLFAMNHYGNDKDDRQGTVVPVAKKKGMGVMMMKTIRPKETVAGVDPSNLIRYALSLEGPDGIIVGMDSRKVVQANIDLLKSFKPMSAAEIERYTLLLNPFFAGNSLQWMNPSYRDGVS